MVLGVVRGGGEEGKTKIQNLHLLKYINMK